MEVNAQESLHASPTPLPPPPGHVPEPPRDASTTEGAATGGTSEDMGVLMPISSSGRRLREPDTDGGSPSSSSDRDSSSDDYRDTLDESSGEEGLRGVRYSPSSSDGFEEDLLLGDSAFSGSEEEMLESSEGDYMEVGIPNYSLTSSIHMFI